MKTIQKSWLIFTCEDVETYFILPVEFESNLF